MEFSRPEYGVGSLSLLQGIFPTQGSNPGLLHCRHILYQLSYQGSPILTIPALMFWLIRYFLRIVKHGTNGIFLTPECVVMTLCL